ncbi:MAG: hypothetical protein ACFFB7_07040, partial [Candidatus Sifarchaeia archaeon]
MVELASIILKTRDLLNLRSYHVYELLEYEDNYAMHPVKQTDNGEVKSLVWIFKEPRVLGVAIIKDLVKRMEETAS